MSLQHPPIERAGAAIVDVEQQFAMEAYQLLTRYAVEDAYVFGNTRITYPVTDYVDISQFDPDEPVISMRLTSMGVIQVPEDVLQTKPPRRFYVVQLEHAKAVEDETHEWRDYISAIINCDDLEDVSVIDSKTGKQLGPKDVVIGLATLRTIAQELRSMIYQDLSNEGECPILYEAIDHNAFAPFESPRFLELSACTACNSLNTPCLHNPQTLN